MILDITYSNIRVFRDETVFSMEATDSVEKGDNVMRVEADGQIVRALKVGAVYGPNAAGKTTIIYVMYILREWLRNIDSPFFENVITPFILNDYSPDLPSSIRIRFVTEGRIMCYSVSFQKGKCRQESLEEETRQGNRLLFKRINSSKPSHSVEYGDVLSGFNPPELNVPADKSVLAIFNNISFPPISVASNYLTSMEIANSYNSEMLRILFLQVRPWLNMNGNRRRLVDFENCFDINLKDIKIPQKDNSTPQDIKYVHPVLDENGDFKKDSDFNATVESTGTKVLTILGAKVLQALDNGSPLFVDEFDSGFHTEVTRTVIRMFLDEEINKKGAQLILTTHNVNLMDERVLRKDQVWFIEKNSSGYSDLFSLAEFEDVAETTDFSEWYLARRFGAIPNPAMLKIRRLFNHK